MKQRIILSVIVLFIISGKNLPAQMTVSGLLDSTVSLRAGAGDSPAFSFGVEEYANLRIRAGIRDKAVFHGAFNFIACNILYSGFTEGIGCVQVGLGNDFGGNIYGAQLGALNGANGVYGVQVGFLNTAEKSVRGVQLGVFNFAPTLQGIQVGLLNFYDDICLPLLMVGW